MGSEGGQCAEEQAHPGKDGKRCARNAASKARWEKKAQACTGTGRSKRPRRHWVSSESRPKQPPMRPGVPQGAGVPTVKRFGCRHGRAHEGRPAPDQPPLDSEIPYPWPVASNRSLGGVRIPHDVHASPGSGWMRVQSPASSRCFGVDPHPHLERSRRPDVQGPRHYHHPAPGLRAVHSGSSEIPMQSTRTLSCLTPTIPPAVADSDKEIA